MDQSITMGTAVGYFLHESKPSNSSGELIAEITAYSKSRYALQIAAHKLTVTNWLNMKDVKRPTWLCQLLLCS
jgi:hypothetical protein